MITTQRTILMTVSNNSFLLNNPAESSTTKPPQPQRKNKSTMFIEKTGWRVGGNREGKRKVGAKRHGQRGEGRGEKRVRLTKCQKSLRASDSVEQRRGGARRNRSGHKQTLCATSEKRER
jgi:hypothetical protein